MSAEDIAHRMERVRSDLDELIRDLNTPRGKFIDPVCWNCAKAHRMYLSGCSQPVYKPCDTWTKTKKCAFEPE